MTPTGIAVDEQGRVWVIENNTHERPANYQGPDSDRILIFSDFDEAGKARKSSVYADGFKNSMGLALATTAPSTSSPVRRFSSSAARTRRRKSARS